MKGNNKWRNVCFWKIVGNVGNNSVGVRFLWSGLFIYFIGLFNENESFIGGDGGVGMKIKLVSVLLKGKVLIWGGRWKVLLDILIVKVLDLVGKREKFIDL